MMTAYAYLRVSTDRQDVDNQRYGLFMYANTHGLGPLQCVEDTASGRVVWRDRAVGRLLTETAHAGDAVLFAEISRIARSTLQVLEMLEHCMMQGVSVHIAKQRLVLDGSIQNRITATVLGPAAEIEREMISLRTTEALAKRKAAGLPPGRPKGTAAAGRLRRRDPRRVRPRAQGPPETQRRQSLFETLWVRPPDLGAAAAGRPVPSRS
jgi:DNA invertase Pin-like site-specific DNA recombinase